MIIDQDQTCAALPRRLTAVLRRADPEAVAKGLQQTLVRPRIETHGPSVQNEFDLRQCTPTMSWMSMASRW